jgi:hypothetical protein
MKKPVDWGSMKFAEYMFTKHGCYWWWRDDEINTFRPFRELTERSAFLYELAARVNGEFEFGKPWIKLHGAQRTVLMDRCDAFRTRPRWLHG